MLSTKSHFSYDSTGRLKVKVQKNIDHDNIIFDSRNLNVKQKMKCLILKNDFKGSHMLSLTTPLQKNSRLNPQDIKRDRKEYYKTIENSLGIFHQEEIISLTMQRPNDRDGKKQI